MAYFPVLDAIQEFKVESNSPPAEFGRFNGGVLNLTTKAGGNVWHGGAFEFFRNEALNARNAFQPVTASKPAYRRHQFGGTVGGPLVRDRTFFFADYQGQRQAIGRTVLSTVPTLLQRQGIFTEAIGGRTPVIYDPAAGTGTARAAFPDNAIPLARMDPMRPQPAAAISPPTAPGTASNYRRAANEIDDQNQWDVRLDHTAASKRDLTFVRVSRFRDRFIPVTPLPDGSGATTGTLGPQETRVWALAATYRHTFSANVLNELRLGDTRRGVERAAPILAGTAGAALGIPGIPVTARFPDTLPTFAIGGYQQLGPPPNTASRLQDGRLAGGRLDDMAGAATRSRRASTGDGSASTSSSRRLRRAPSRSTPSAATSRRPGTGAPLASFLLGQVQIFSIDLQRSPIRSERTSRNISSRTTGSCRAG